VPDLRVHIHIHSIVPFYSQFFVQTMHRPGKVAQTEIAAKRQRINQRSAVITSEDFAQAIADVQGAKKLVGKKHSSKSMDVIKKRQRISSSSSSTSVSDAECVQHPHVGDYVLLKLITTGKKRQPAYYVGYVTSRNGADYKIQCMRRNGTASNAFYFPPESDISDFGKECIISVLHLSKENRGIYYFSDNLTQYQYLH
jgi:hypothetical protein